VKRQLWGAGLAGVLVLGLNACAGSDRGSTTTTGEATGGGSASASAGEAP